MVPGVYGFTYVAPAGCPTREAVVASIHRYTRGTQFTDRASDDGQLSVVISKAGDGYRAAIRFSRNGNPGTHQVVPGASCSETAGAAALVASILVDPSAGQRTAETSTSTEAASGAASGDESQPVPSNASGTMEPQPAPSSASRTTEPQTVPSGKSVEALVLVEPARADTPVEDRGNRADKALRKQRVRYGASAFAGVSSLIGGSAPLDVLAGVHAESTDPGLLSPFFGLSFHYSGSTVTAASANAAFRLFAGRLTACPIRVWVLKARGWLSPCAAFELGHFGGTGDVSASRSPGLLYSAAVLLARAELLFGPFFVGLEGGATFPLPRDTFHFSPATDEVVYQIPAVAFEGRIGAGVHFP
jgi:hypothetical protein